MPYYRRRYGIRRRRRGFRSRWGSRRFARPRGGRRMYKARRRQWPRGKVTFPAKVFKKLTYKDYGFTQSLTDIAHVGSYLFAGNNIYDPDVSGTGVSCYDYSKVEAMYGIYRCLGSRITVLAYCKSSTNQPWINLKCKIYPSRSTNVGADPVADVTPRLRYKTLYCPNYSGKQMHVKNYCPSSYWYPNKTEWQAFNVINDDPELPWYWIVEFQEMTEVECVIHFDVNIVYYCQFQARTDPSY